MHSGPRIGRILGVNLFMDRSWGLVLPLTTWELGIAVFPGWYPQLDAGFIWGMALAASLLLFVAVLAHDLAHLVAAKASQVPLRHVTLCLFGGVPDISCESTSPAGELVMAIAGPALSLFLGGMLALLGIARAAGLYQFANVTQVLAGLDPVSILLLWSGGVNILLGAINLIPGFPLDGGRALRSMLWRETGDLRWATHWVSKIGQLVAVGLVATGLFMLGARPAFSEIALLGGLWLGLSGWLLNNAAAQSDHWLAVEDVLRTVPVAQLMSARVPTVPPNIPLSHLVDEYITGNDDRAFPVIENDHMVGLVYAQDVCKVPRERWDTMEVGEIMTSASRVAVARPGKAGIDAIKDLIPHPVTPRAVGVECLPGQEID